MEKRELEKIKKEFKAKARFIESNLAAFDAGYSFQG
jgi:Pyruvate/2-oxoacid:ferredoxin oxidoreductase gamma subunit